MIYTKDLIEDDKITYLPIYMELFCNNVIFLLKLQLSHKTVAL